MAVDKFEFAEAFTKFTIQDREYRAGMTRINQGLKRLQLNLDAAAVHARRFLFVAGGAMAAFVKFAADAEESESRFRAVFKDQAGDVKRWSEALGEAVGRSARGIRATVSSFQAFFVGMGFGGREAAELSKRMQELAIDFASFNNLTDAEATERFISALSGSSEVVAMFGINLKEAAIKQELLRMGLEGSVQKAGEQEKALARLNIIMRAMGQQGAVGDAARTAGSMTNQLRKLKDQMIDAAVVMGEQFIPAAQRMVGVLSAITNAMKDMDPRTKSAIASWVLFGVTVSAAIIILQKLVAMFLVLKTAMRASAIGLILTSLGLLAAAFVTAAIKGQRFTDMLEEMGKSLLGIVTDADRAVTALKRIEALAPEKAPPKAEDATALNPDLPNAALEQKLAGARGRLSRAETERQAAVEKRAADRRVREVGAGQFAHTEADIRQAVFDVFHDLFVFGDPMAEATAGIKGAEGRTDIRVGPRTATEVAEARNLEVVSKATTVVNAIAAEIRGLEEQLNQRRKAVEKARTDAGAFAAGKIGEGFDLAARKAKKFARDFADDFARQQRRAAKENETATLEMNRRREISERGFGAELAGDEDKRVARLAKRRPGVATTTATPMASLQSLMQRILGKENPLDKERNVLLKAGNVILKEIKDKPPGVARHGA